MNVDRARPPARFDVVYPSARRMSPKRRREQLVSTALALYAARPPELVTVDDVSRAADVSRALFYRYFANIHELRVAALRAVVDEVIAAITPPEEAGLLDQVRYSLNALLGSAQTYASAYVALMRTGSLIATDETNALVDSVREHVVRMVGERLRPGEPVAPMLELTLRSWFAVVEGASVTWLRDGVPTQQTLENWLVDQLVAMLNTTAQHDPDTAAQLIAAFHDTVDFPPG
ncbi:MAG: TetR/AcrR family transcriptional regulator [Pseudonocardia sp.]|nr:TetR/AcrR family transcriptional regulator [Pseudonocardia sp.]